MSSRSSRSSITTRRTPPPPNRLVQGTRTTPKPVAVVAESVNITVEEIERVVADMHSDITVLAERCAPFVVPDRMSTGDEASGPRTQPTDRSLLRDRLEQALNSLAGARARVVQLTQALDV